MYKSETNFERDSSEIATQQEMLQLLAEVAKITVFGENMGEWGRHWGTEELVDDLDNGHVGSATHKNNLDILPVSCKFDKNALQESGRRLVAQLTMGDHNYDFFITDNSELSDEDYVEGEYVSTALEEMWDCDELYSVTFDESGNSVPRDPNKPVYMPVSRYTLSNAELLEVYVDMPPDRRKFARSIARAAQVLAELLPEDVDIDSTHLESEHAVESADRDQETREFEVNLGITQIDGTTARQLAKSLAEDYKINVRW